MKTYLFIMEFGHQVLLTDPDILIDSLPEKRSRHIRFFSDPNDSLSALHSSLLTRYALHAAAGIEEPIRITPDSSGKPFLPDFPEIHFNRSHSGSMVICAVSDRAIGADIERVRPIDPETMKAVLSEQEYRAVCISPDPLSLFFTFWTLKESYLKYKGTGLGENPADHTIIISDKKAGAVSDPSAWLKEISVHPDYRAAVCLKQPGTSLNIQHVHPEQAALFAGSFV